MEEKSRRWRSGRIIEQGGHLERREDGERTDCLGHQVSKILLVTGQEKPRTRLECGIEDGAVLGGDRNRRIWLPGKDAEKRILA